MDVLDQFYQDVEDGREGRNNGISTGMPFIDQEICGIQPGCITNILSGSSGGKTSLLLDVYVYNILRDAVDKNKHLPTGIIYFSFEMSKVTLIAKLVSIHLYRTRRLVVPFNEISI